MAHLKELGPIVCCRYPKLAEVEVFNCYNASLGYYCRFHGERKVASMTASELAMKPRDPR